MEMESRDSGEQLREMAEKVFQLLERLKLAELAKNKAMEVKQPLRGYSCFISCSFILSCFLASHNRHVTHICCVSFFYFVMAFNSHHFAAEDTLSTVALTVVSV